jgi:hypothetical protein
MRLAQLRDWLGGQGWYDLTQSRVAGGYESHWSRLIDAGLAARCGCSAGSPSRARPSG